jgi:hypothetical protein
MDMRRFEQQFSQQVRERLREQHLSRQIMEALAAAASPKNRHQIVHGDRMTTQEDMEPLRAYVFLGSVQCTFLKKEDQQEAFNCVAAALPERLLPTFGLDRSPLWQLDPAPTAGAEFPPRGCVTAMWP